MATSAVHERASNVLFTDELVVSVSGEKFDFLDEQLPSTMYHHHSFLCAWQVVMKQASR